MRLLLATICTACLMTAACDGDSVRITSTTTDNGDAKGVLKVIDTLQCPETIGVLTRRGSAQAGGTTCLYTGPRGSEVTLQLVSLADKDVDTVLSRFENELGAAMPHTTAELRASADAEKARAEAEVARAQAEVARAEANVTEAAARADEAAARADAAAHRASGQPRVAVEAHNDRASVRLPGMSVDADGGRASVRIGGFSINADDSSQTVDIASADEAVSVQAHENAAEIRTRAPGDATQRTYMLTDSRAADQGWRLVGYEARGPAGGPIVVATVRSKDRNSGSVFDAAKDLVTLNVGE